MIEQEKFDAEQEKVDAEICKITVVSDDRLSFI